MFINKYYYQISMILRFLTVVCLGTLIILVLLVFDYSDEMDELEDRMYCENTALWVQDTDNGVLEIKRRGWPDFRGTRDELCAEEE